MIALYAAPGVESIFDREVTFPYPDNFTPYFPAHPKTPASKMEAEALAMADCAAALAKLDPESRKRVVEWLARQVEGDE